MVRGLIKYTFENGVDLVDEKPNRQDSSRKL